ncbi:MAG: hypothetical protein QOD82_4037 [Pseudonocardiales bacterium]|nr:hypothetical protein [Pseudonocardiales bacterium]
MDRSVPGRPFGDRSRPLGALRSERPERGGNSEALPATTRPYPARPAAERVRVRGCWVYSAEDHLARTGSGRVGSAARNVG